MPANAVLFSIVFGAGEAPPRLACPSYGLGNPSLTEQAYAHLGRTLLAQGQPTRAGEPLLQARDIFTRLQAAPALGETDALLGRASALSS